MLMAAVRERGTGSRSAGRAAVPKPRARPGLLDVETEDMPRAPTNSARNSCVVPIPGSRIDGQSPRFYGLGVEEGSGELIGARNTGLIPLPQVGAFGQGLPVDKEIREASRKKRCEQNAFGPEPLNSQPGVSGMNAR